MQMGRQERANAVRILTDGQQQLRAVKVPARVRYAVSLIVCDASGGFSMEEVERGMRDDRIVALARQLLAEAKVL
jgi:hypothetical protein